MNPRSVNQLTALSLLTRPWEGPPLKSSAASYNDADGDGDDDGDDDADGDGDDDGDDDTYDDADDHADGDANDDADDDDGANGGIRTREELSDGMSSARYLWLQARMRHMIRS